MAEYVEQRMEEMIPEVEELERVGLLNNWEVKELIKKRKHFEYKIQKRTKQKEDFLGYIEYESNMLTLIALRRDEIGYQHKKGQIEGGIKNRINKLYKILCHRWQSDLKIWLSYTDWLTKMKWKSSVGKVNLRLLQVHSNNPKLWISAAKFEFESGSAASGRQIMLRGLRFHPTSRLLHKEYIKLELLFVEKLMARKKMLEVKKEEKEGSDGEGEEDKEEEVPDKDEVDDSILRCDLVNLVVEAALNAIPEADFAVSIFLLARQFPFAEKVQKTILNVMETKFIDQPVTVDTKARLELEKEGKFKDLLSKCIAVYMGGLNESKSGDLFHLAFSTLKELPNSAKSSSKLILRELLKLLKFGQEHELLNIEEYEFWLKLFNVNGNQAQAEDLLQDALSKFPKHLDFWCMKLALDVGKCQGEEKMYSETLDSAQKSVHKSDKEKLWSNFIQIMNKAGKAEEAYELLELATERENLGELRVLLLERTREKGLEKCRDIYSKYKLLPPFKEQLHKVMLEIEVEQDQVSKKHVRDVYTILCNQFGGTNVDAWINWITWEEKTGSVLEVPNIVCRAEANLNKDLLKKFTTLREFSNS